MVVLPRLISEIIHMSKRVASHLGTPVTRRKSGRIEMQKAATEENDKIPRSKNNEVPNSSGFKVTCLELPVKSENDKKDYRVIRLENGLTAVMISDTSEYEQPSSDKDLSISSDENEASSTDDFSDDGAESTSSDDKGPKSLVKLAAASLSVGVGSFSDPIEYPGLAHFLEHMVFMGSKKYPKENDFDSFIKKRGGSNNAYTEWDCTTFYFEARQDYLAESLDRFAQFFVEPLMKQESIAREREAVESEFQMSVTSDTHRKQQLLCSLAEEGHPISKFPWGDIRTLCPKDGSSEGDVLVREQLFMFLRRHYSAHRMTLAIQGRMSLDDLQEMVCKSFSCVPCNNLPSDVIAKVGPWSSPFPKEKFHRVYKVKPIKDICQAELRWILPPKRHLYKTKPHSYVSWLIGHEGKGSLLSYLRERVWALDIYAGVGEDSFEDNNLFCQFSVTIILTESGLKNIEEVVAATFGYIDMLKKEGPSENIFKELQSIEETSFRFLEEEAAVEYVESLSEDLQNYPTKDLLCGPSLFYSFQPQDILDVLDLLRRDTVNIMILSKDILDPSDQLLTEKWFGTQYFVEEIPPSWISKKCEGNFHFPFENKFLPSNFDLLPITEDASALYPTCVRCDDSLELWMKQDAKFRLPHMHCYLNLISPIVLTSPHAASMLDLFLCILKHQLVEEVYAADVSGHSYSINAADRGIILKVNGFHDKLPLLLETILEHMVNFRKNLNETVFQAWKKKQQQAYFNSFLQPKKLAHELYLSLVLQTNWNSVEKHSAISQVTSDLLVEFVESILLKRLYVQCLIQGNVSKEKALSLGNRIMTLLNYQPVIPRTRQKMRVCQVPLGEYYCRAKSFNNDDKNTSLTNYYQIGCITLKSSCIVEVLLMMMEEPLFDELRTKQQLGYHVACCLRDTFGILGFTVTVDTHADKHNVNDVDDKVEDFLHDFLRLVMSPEGATELEVVCGALIKVKQCVDNHLEEEVSRNWAEIVSSDYMFDRLQREVKYLKELTVKDIRKWVKSHITSCKKKNLRKLSVQVVGIVDEVGTEDLNPQLKNSKQIVNETMKNISGEKTLMDVPVSKDGCHGDYQMEFLGGRTFPRSPSKHEQMSNILTHCYRCKSSGKKDSKCEMSEDHFIMDVEAFKNELYLYPIHKMDGKVPS